MNRSIQSEGANGIIQVEQVIYQSSQRRGSKALNLEIAMICCGFNLHKFHLKKPAIKKSGINLKYFPHFQHGKNAVFVPLCLLYQNSAKIVIFAIWHKKESRFPKSRKS